MRIRKKVYYPGDFSFFDDDNWSISLIDAYNAVEMIGPNGWDELKNHSPIKKIKYGDNIVINKIYHNMVFTHPSKLHYTVIMRNLEFIAKKGWDPYVKFWTDLNGEWNDFIFPKNQSNLFTKKQKKIF